jgi:hypothetical protein
MCAIVRGITIFWRTPTLPWVRTRSAAHSGACFVSERIRTRPASYRRSWKARLSVGAPVRGSDTQTQGSPDDDRGSEP